MRIFLVAIFCGAPSGLGARRTAVVHVMGAAALSVPGFECILLP